MGRDAVDEAEEESVEAQTVGDYPYHDITNSEFGQLQKAITNAKTKSDFEKLENIIKHGKIPKDNWHGKGNSYEMLRNSNTNDNMEYTNTTVTGNIVTGQSSLYKMSDSGNTTNDSEYNGLPQMDGNPMNNDHHISGQHNGKQLNHKKRGQKLVAL